MKLIFECVHAIYFAREPVYTDEGIKALMLIEGISHSRYEPEMRWRRTCEQGWAGAA